MPPTRPGTRDGARDHVPLRRRIAFHLIVLVLSLAVAAAAVEGTLAISPPDAKDTFAAWRRGVSYLEDDVADWKLEPRVYAPGQRTNEHALRGRALPFEKPPGRYRIIVTGGSAAYDYFSADDHTWPHYVELMLRCATGRPVDVINAGTPGYSTWQAVRQLKGRLMAWRPDMIVHYELYNDSLYFRHSSRATIIEGWKRNGHSNYVGWFAHPHPFFAGAGAVLPRTTDFVRMALVRSALERGRKSTHEIFSNPRSDSTVHPTGFGFYEENLRGMASFLRERGVAFGIVGQASLIKPDNTAQERGLVHYHYRGLNHDRLVAAYEMAWSLAERIAGEHANAFFIPAQRLVPRDLDHFVDEVHTSNRGTVALAAVVAERIAPRIVAAPRSCRFEMGERNLVSGAVGRDEAPAP